MSCEPGYTDRNFLCSTYNEIPVYTAIYAYYYTMFANARCLARCISGYSIQNLSNGEMIEIKLNKDNIFSEDSKICEKN